MTIKWHKGNHGWDTVELTYLHDGKLAWSTTIFRWGHKASYANGKERVIKST
jgi:hypothetical protein